jgi:phosphoribosylanthranilate isomerase
VSVFVKICGLANEEDLRGVAALRPDAVGFVFWERSPRFVTAEAVASWRALVPAGVLKVGVFVDAPAEEMQRAVRTAGLDVIQLHGFQGLEKPCVKVSKVWKVVHLGRTPIPSVAGAAAVDAFLVDRYSAESPGGTGRTVDWSRAREFVERCGKPVLLAGGLTPDNVAEAIRRVRPWGVDVSSGVESRPGRKDLERVRRFIEQCRRG